MPLPKPMFFHSFSSEFLNFRSPAASSSIGLSDQNLSRMLRFFNIEAAASGFLNSVNEIFPKKWSFEARAFRVAFVTKPMVYNYLIVNENYKI
eukprot:c40994_g1_i1 orf=97-375(-)